MIQCPQKISGEACAPLEITPLIRTLLQSILAIWNIAISNCIEIPLNYPSHSIAFLLSIKNYKISSIYVPIDNSNIPNDKMKLYLHYDTLYTHYVEMDNNNVRVCVYGTQTDHEI